MNPQQNLYYNSDFQVPESTNRSPGASRPYGTISNPGQGGRRGGLESLSQAFQAPIQYGEENRLQYDRYDRGGGMPQNNYMMDNSQGWGYNVATINGAMNGANRYRQSTRRAGIPQAWTQPDVQGSLAAPPVFQNPMMGGPIGLNGHSPHHIDPFGGGMMRDDKDQIIPTAIVIKNIPFSVRKEQLAGLMADMNLPQPYAFNYHFDAGIFRGLAFANFQSPEETKMVIDSMNQLDVNGRKLRVEYKKMLPEHERERIEREKREKRGQLQEQHQPLALNPQTSIPQLSATISNSSVKQSAGPLRDVDLNNPDTLSFYTELTLFKNDAAREVFIFPPTISPEQRRQVHILAHNLGLEHQSIGEGETRQLQVYKRNQISPVSSLPTVSYDHNRRGLSRAATIDFAESRIASTGTGFHPISRPGPMLELPGSPDVSGTTLSNLRAAKSFADLRSYSPSPAPSQSSIAANPPNPPINANSSLPVARYGEYGGSLNTPNLTPSTPGGNGPMSTPSTNTGESGVIAGMSGLNLGFDRPRENPGAIGSQRPGANGNSKQARVVGSDWDAAAFAGRRANGHMQRNSGDSSDNNRDGRSGGSRLY
ncbi:RNA-binding post-transcriptional regulator cip2 [Zalerion maritima]|uniref:RNA-binding post-transcriptional regulator cip2 n=1 Tax=Zalerion maritima TaxID=339359 RepID=A0AAD5RIY3_9PEZI|nr:RNA-binding post-transcriptional regulator cip2 [Zalerion maritima]